MSQRFSIFLVALMTACAALASNASAQTTSKSFTAVVELFTSQGCSSCPPADKLFKTYVDRPDVLALTFPVDYWDYLGWKDTFASPQYSRRQRSYANTRGDGAVYTPQAVINGAAHMNGADERVINATIERSASQSLTVPVEIQLDGQTLTITTGTVAEEVGKGKCTIWLAMVQKSGKVPVRRGENSGRKLTYHNIVRRLTPIGMWSGEASSFQVPESAVNMPETSAYAVLVQRGSHGNIIGAAWLTSNAGATN
jgi:hypothetical protein